MAEYNIEINKYKSSTNSYDKLYPITKVENVIGYQPPLVAQISVNVDTNSIVTATKGSIVLTKTSVNNNATFNIPELGTWHIKATLKDKTAEDDVLVDLVKFYEINLAYNNVYGVQWDGTPNTKWSRTDKAIGFTNPTPAVNNGTGSSPFDTLMPWSGMKRSTDPQAGEVVSIPKFYYKWTKIGNGLKLQIADKKVEGFLVSPAHMDRGDGKGERDVVYIGRYHCSSSNWKSVSGHNPKNNVTRSNARSSIHNLGATIWQWDWHMHMTIWMLYLVEFADWNCQTAIGYGCGNNSDVESMGRTDGMRYHTGTSQSSRTTYGVGVQYRYIEGLWDNVRDWVDGCYYNSAGLNIINNPAKFSDTTNGTPAGVPTGGYPSKFEVKTVNGFQVIYPVQSNGSSTTYTCDGWDFSASRPCLGVGGCYSQGLGYGIGYVSCNGVSVYVADIGPRLQKLP